MTNHIFGFSQITVCFANNCHVFFVVIELKGDRLVTPSLNAGPLLLIPRKKQSVDYLAAVQQPPTLSMSSAEAPPVFKYQRIGRLATDTSKVT
jgi:hypothetical protein